MNIYKCQENVLIVIASECNERGNLSRMRHLTFVRDRHVAKAPRDDTSNFKNLFFCASNIYSVKCQWQQSLLRWPNRHRKQMAAGYRSLA